MLEEQTLSHCPMGWIERIRAYRDFTTIRMRVMFLSDGDQSSGIRRLFTRLFRGELHHGVVCSCGLHVRRFGGP